MEDLLEVFNNREFEEIDNVLKMGLRCKNRLIAEGLTEDEPILHEFEAWRRNLIYFGLSKPPSESSWISILVDPSQVSVGNMILELSYDSYKKSIMTLKEYLKRQRGTGKYNHPLNARRLRRPKIMSFQNTYRFIRGEREELERGVYIPEIFIECQRIAPSRFCRFNKGKDR